MNNFLAVDTSSRYLTVLAVKDGKPFLRHLPDCAMRHSVMLMDEIDKTLTQAGLTGHKNRHIRYERLCARHGQKIEAGNFV